MTQKTLRKPLFLAMCGVAVVLGTLSGGSAAQASLLISKDATKNVTCNGSVCMATAQDAVLNVTELAAMLSSSDTTIQTGTRAKDMELMATLSWTSPSRLTLDAYQSIAIDKPLTVAGPGSLTLTDRDGGGGYLHFNDKGRISFWDQSSTFALDGQPFTLVRDLATLARDIANNPSGDYALANDYDATADGTYSSSPVGTTFNGIFEGLGNSISNVAIKNSGATDVGLFARTFYANIKDINVAGLRILSKGSVGKSVVGGLVAENDGFLSYDRVAGTISENGSGVSDIGGIAGQNSSDAGWIMFCSTNIKIRGDKAPSVGGIVGSNFGVVYASRGVGPTSGSTAVGGLVGTNRGNIVMSFATGAVTALGPASAAGGLAGTEYAGGGYSIRDSYASGNVSANVTGYAGGLVGLRYSGQVEFAYSTGAPSAGGYEGGLVGFDGAANENLKHLYWDMDTSGIANPSQGAGNIADEPGLKGLTTKQFLSGLPKKFETALWAEDPKINGGFPYLVLNPP